ncbi:uncharacterized protein J7T54_000744 [Emericellopsis cladophorae]|uniref:Uncharacterized protein n=1 Tax=Emericellopsis cladophorae TaxID=2686198 RepID=A0A9P9XWH2_9HYPO|nr:uncharacterized protein J7T54_000744 [Emericellopsis cladophorae]KAI6778710.1 hypothetical protein J7T54_000744 [Emericellopsis cladophorae]
MCVYRGILIKCFGTKAKECHKFVYEVTELTECANPDPANPTECKNSPHFKKYLKVLEASAPLGGICESCFYEQEEESNGSYPLGGFTGNDERDEELANFFRSPLNTHAYTGKYGPITLQDLAAAALARSTGWEIATLHGGAEGIQLDAEFVVVDLPSEDSDYDMVDAVEAREGQTGG